jgi:hypothetical protein
MTGRGSLIKSETSREKLICEALPYTQWLRPRAAHLPGMPPSTFSSQLRPLEVDPRSFANRPNFSLPKVETPWL